MVAYSQTEVTVQEAQLDVIPWTLTGDKASETPPEGDFQSH